MATPKRFVHEKYVRVPIQGGELEGNLTVPVGAEGLVIFAHGSGSSRHSPRNRFVAGEIQDADIGTLLIDLLTEEEEEVDLLTAEVRFDIELLTTRLISAIDWASQNADTRDLGVGCFGASTGAAAALAAAAQRPHLVNAVVSRGGRPDLAAEWLPHVEAPTLLIVGGDDEEVIPLNRSALARISAPGSRIHVVPGATHLFEEPGTLEEVARQASDWFKRYLHAATPAERAA